MEGCIFGILRYTKYGYLHSNQQKHHGISSPLLVQYYMSMFGCL